MAVDDEKKKKRWFGWFSACLERSILVILASSQSPPWFFGGEYGRGSRNCHHHPTIIQDWRAHQREKHHPVIIQKYRKWSSNHHPRLKGPSARKTKRKRIGSHHVCAITMFQPSGMMGKSAQSSTPKVDDGLPSSMWFWEGGWFLKIIHFIKTKPAFVGHPLWRLAFGGYVGYRAMSQQKNLLLKDLLLKCKYHFKSKSFKRGSCAGWKY